MKVKYVFYKEKNGAFLVIDASTNKYYKDNLSEDAFEGRSCILFTPNPEYVSTSAISREYLKKCERVAKKNVPVAWLKVLV